ncbi:MAG TPA: hypothetical protein VHE53_05590 [Patescibacteria group bacterium]|nr:hypothetical protein [Patescibacteria group bacterium]
MINKICKVFSGIILSVLLVIIYGVLSGNYAIAASDPIGEWTLSDSSLPNSLANHVITAKDHKIYIFGGATTDDYSQVYSATVGSNGSLGVWALNNNLPATRYGMASALTDNKIYILGGLHYDGTTSFTNSVYLSTIQNDGALNSWQELTPLPQGIVEGESVIVGNRIYFAGGTNSSGSHDEIYMTNLDQNGNLGSWSIISHLPRALTSFGFVTYNNKIYVIGGNGGGIRNEVYSTMVNPMDGSLSSWQLENYLIQPFSDKNQTVISGNTIVIAGGADGVGTSQNVYYTSINQDGSLMPWQESVNHLSQPVAAGAMTYSNGYLYLTGGVDSSGYTNRIYYAKFNIETDLNIPPIKQTNLVWANKAYDSASVWSPAYPNISSWGCALTSAVMVFRFHGLNKMVGGTDLDPSTVNDWLISQPDGYIGNGLVNWIALSRLSRLIKGANNVNFDALQYIRTSGYNKSKLLQDLNNGLPGILEEPGHFVVAKGTIGNSFLINDPYYNRQDLTSYSDVFSSLGTFTPSQTDLSYLLLVIDSDSSIQLKNNSGDSVGDSFIQFPLENDDSPGKVSGQPIKMYYLPMPISGSYYLTLSSNKTHLYKLRIYYYDKDGNVKIGNLDGILGVSNSDSFNLNFDKNNLNNESSKQNITFDDLIEDVNALCKTKDLKVSSCLMLSIQAKLARDLGRNRITKVGAISLLRSMQQYILSQKGRDISTSAWVVLNNDITGLLIAN